MPIPRASAVLGLTLLLGGDFLAHGGGIPVWDELAGAQRVQAMLTQAAAYLRQGQQIINEYNLIRNQITQITHDVTNLQRIPQGLNFFTKIQAYSTNLTNLLNQATSLSYEINSASAQFEDLYSTTALLATTDLKGLRQKMLSARQEASLTAVKTQAIKQNLEATVQRILQLMNGSWLAKGNLDSHQLKAQQDAVQASQAAQALVVQTTDARLRAMSEAEQVAMQQMTIRVQEDFARSAPRYDGAAGALPTWRWMDR